MRYCKFVCIVSAFLLHHVTYSKTLSEQIDAIIEKQLPHATVGVVIKEAQTNKIVYSRNANKLLSPASSIKLFTAAAALYQLKPDYRFLTTLSQKDDNYYLTFTGSPSFTVANLNALLMNLKNDNGTIIKGNIVIDSSQYQEPYYPGGTSYDDLGWYYSAPDTAAILNKNRATYELISAEELGKPVQIKPKTMDHALKIINEVITVSKDEEKNHCSLNLEIKPGNTVRLFGCMVQGKNPKLIELAIPDPILLVQQEIKRILDKNKMALKGHVTTGVSPTDAQLIASFQSANLIKMLTHMLQESDNLYANSFTKKLAYSLTGNGTHKEGAFAIKKILSEHTHLDMTQLQLTDGEGTRYNLVTTEQITVLLSDLYHDKEMRAILLSTLPEAGVSGTLKERMKKTILAKKVYAKTGSMHDISSLSGFLMSPNGKVYIFSIIINGINEPLEKAKLLEENILLTVDNY